MDTMPAWLPHGQLDNHVSTEVARGIIDLARSSDPHDTDLLMRIGMTQGLRHARFAIDAIAAERELFNAREVRRLEWTLIAVTTLTFFASVAQAVAAIV